MALRVRLRPPLALHRSMPATQGTSSESGIPKCSLRSRMNTTSRSSTNLPAIRPQVGYVGQRGTHLMVPFDYAQRVLQPNSSCGTPPCTAPSPYFAANPTLYSVLGNSRRRRRHCFRHQVQWHHEIRLIASGAAEAADSRFAVSGLVYLLQVHVRQHGVLRRVEQCPECLGILAERLRSEIGVGAMLLRRHSRPFSLCGLRPSFWARKDGGEGRQWGGQ
jgi:hypothetical protein